MKLVIGFVLFLSSTVLASQISLYLNSFSELFVSHYSLIHSNPISGRNGDFLSFDSDYKTWRIADHENSMSLFTQAADGGLSLSM